MFGHFLQHLHLKKASGIFGQHFGGRQVVIEAVKPAGVELQAVEGYRVAESLAEGKRSVYKNKSAVGLIDAEIGFAEFEEDRQTGAILTGCAELLQEFASFTGTELLGEPRAGTEKEV